MNDITSTLLFVVFIIAAFFAGINHERHGCMAIAKIFGCVPNEVTK